MAAVPSRPGPKSLPVDRAQAFSERAGELLRAGLVRCEERYPLDGPHSVVVAVVDRNAALWSEKLKPIHQELFGSNQSDPLAPVQLEVIDRATDEAIQRLIAAGLISKTTRATRPLSPAADKAESAPLSSEEQAKVKAQRDRTARKLKMAQVLGDAGFGDEARPALLEAMHALGCALAVERRLAEPADVKDVLQPPLAHCWAEAVPVLQTFVQDPAADWKPVAELLARF